MQQLFRHLDNGYVANSSIATLTSVGLKLFYDIVSHTTNSPASLSLSRRARARNALVSPQVFVFRNGQVFDQFKDDVRDALLDVQSRRLKDSKRCRPAGK